MRCLEALRGSELAKKFSWREKKKYESFISRLQPLHLARDISYYSTLKMKQICNHNLGKERGESYKIMNIIPVISGGSTKCHQNPTSNFGEVKYIYLVDLNRCEVTFECIHTWHFEGQRHKKKRWGIEYLNGVKIHLLYVEAKKKQLCDVILPNHMHALYSSAILTRMGEYWIGFLLEIESPDTKKKIA